MGLDILAGLIVWWLAGAFTSYLLLAFYESIRPSDATKQLDEQEKKDIRKAMAKLALQTGLITAGIWLIIRLK